MDSNPKESPSSANKSNEQKIEESQFDSLLAILLKEERERIHQLELESQRLQSQLKSQETEFQKHIDLLQSDLDQLQEQIAVESESLIPRLINQMSHIISNTIRNSRDELAEALGPIMSDALRIQIRDSRKSMVESLYPVILETVQRAIAEFAREFQRNIDARVKSTFGPQGIRRTISARLRGVSPSELALRDSLPFSVEELFLIQQESGLLMAHNHNDDLSANDSDLISGMLTAIRSFAQDSFGDEETEQELHEIQYGDKHIIIQSGEYVYLAVVIKGIEPAGFRTQIHNFVSDLHIQKTPLLRDYDGDPDHIPQIPTQLLQLTSEISAESKPQAKSLSPGQRWLLFGFVEDALFSVI